MRFCKQMTETRSLLPDWRNIMINTATKSTGVMNRDSILSINKPQPQSVKNQSNIMTLVKNAGGTGTSGTPQIRSGQPQCGQSQNQIRQTPSGQSQNRSPQTPLGQSQNRSPQPLSGQSQSRSPQTPSGQSQRRPAPQPPLGQSQNRPPRQPQNVQPALTAGQQNTASTPGMPAARPIPPLSNKVQKGQKILLSNTALSAVNACFGWNVTDARCDVDVSAFLLGADGKIIGDSWFVFYGQTTSPDQSTRFVAGSTDREMIQIDLKRLDPQVKKIVFVLTINDALKDRLHFGMLKDAYVRILDPSGRELVSFLMTEYYNNVISMMIGELYLHNGAWKFSAVGNGVARDLAGLCELYGVQVV